MDLRALSPCKEEYWYYNIKPYAPRHDPILIKAVENGLIEGTLCETPGNRYGVLARPYDDHVIVNPDQIKDSTYTDEMGNTYEFHPAALVWFDIEPSETATK